MTKEEASIFNKQLGQAVEDGNVPYTVISAGIYGVEWGKNSRDGEVAALKAQIMRLTAALDAAGDFIAARNLTAEYQTYTSKRNFNPFQ